MLFVQPYILGAVSLLGRLCLHGAAAAGEGHSSSQPGIFPSHQNQAQDIVGLAFKTQDSDSSEHFTKSH